LLLLPKIVFPPASHLLIIRQDQSHLSTSAWTLSPSTTGHILLQRQSRSKISGSCGAPTSRLTMADDSGIYHGPFRTKKKIITGSCDGLHHRPSPSRHMTISSCSDAGSRNRHDVQLTSNLRFPSSNWMPKKGPRICAVNLEVNSWRRPLGDTPASKAPT
jgi:hypothetical protein